MALTEPKTLALFVQELMDDKTLDPDLPAIRGRRDGSEADVEECTILDSTPATIRVKLTDGSKFAIRIERTL